MTHEQLKPFKPSAFKRKCGVHRETFERMVEVLRPHLDRRGKQGGQCRLSAVFSGKGFVRKQQHMEDQLLLVLE